VIDRMQQRGIATRRGLMAAHREAPYRDTRRVGTLPHTELATDQTLVIPIYSGLSGADRTRVAEELIAAVRDIG
jgi:dTDP-4-amino-4,6-dideoxygalactose transaminase